jgi:hypothetical protein
MSRGRDKQACKMGQELDRAMMDAGLDPNEIPDTFNE